MTANLKCNLQKNLVICDDTVHVQGVVDGDDNKIIIKKISKGANINLNIHGSNNVVFIDESKFIIKNLRVDVGNFNHANNTKLIIGNNFQCTQAVFLLYNPKNELLIGDGCMFSSGITIRCGELPHLIFDNSKKDYIDHSEGVKIGSHVWCGEGVYITKNTTIPNHCIIAAKSVVTKRFANSNCVLAGNPAREAKKNIAWYADRRTCKNLNDELSKIFEMYYEKSMYYEGSDIIEIDTFIRKQRDYLLEHIS